MTINRVWIFLKTQSSSDDLLFDRQLFWIALCLMLIGLVIVTSASFPVGLRIDNNPYYFMQRHMIFLAISLAVATFTLYVPIEKLQKYSHLFMIAAFIGLILVLFIGNSVNGAARWIPLGPLNVQPAEVAKLALFIFISNYLNRRAHQVRTQFYDGYVKPFLVLGALGGLLLLQPDFGSLVVMIVTTVALLFIAGVNIAQFLGLGVFLAVMFAIVILAEPYRVSRVTSFLDPWENPFSSGYQLTQSLMAFGRGDWFGQGLGNSVQKLEYLPEAHTDFIFSVLAEELGFIGVTLVLLLIFSLVLKALLIGKKAFKQNQLFEGFLATAIAVWFAFQTMVNIGAATAIMPTKGLTLPLISYGGSSLVIMTTAVAILLRIDFESRLRCQQNQQGADNNNEKE